MGGIHCNAEGNRFMWRTAFPAEVQSRLVSADNPDGTITNSDLEHASMLAKVSTMAERHPVQ